MATDYDAPRRTESDDVAEDSLEELKEHRNDAAASIIDVDETDVAESFELPGGGPVRGGTLGAGRAQASRRVHLLDLLPGPPPPPLRRGTRRSTDLPRLRGITRAVLATTVEVHLCLLRTTFRAGSRSGVIYSRPASSRTPISAEEATVV